MPKPLPPLPPKVDEFHRKRNLTLWEVVQALDMPSLYDWFPSNHVKLTAYIEIAKAANLTLNQMYDMIIDGRGSEVMARAQKTLKAVDLKDVARKLNISRGLPQRIGANRPECRSLEKAHRIAKFYKLEIEDLLEPP